VHFDGVNGDGSQPDANDMYDENGGDRTLVRTCLRETTLERLEALEDVLLLREAVGSGRESLPSAV
jgi:hypothetical protein